MPDEAAATLGVQSGRSGVTMSCRLLRQPPEGVKMDHSVLLLNASYEVLSFVSWQRAATLLACEHAYVFESVPGEFIRSPRLVLPAPVSIVLSEWVNVPYRIFGDSDTAARMAVLRRDGFVCGYCGGKGSTVDHILPKSRGGLDTFGNLITACAPCNQAKDDRTPEESQMPLLWQPYDPRGNAKLQQRIYKLLANSD